jgi:hypothetical protein
VSPNLLFREVHGLTLADVLPFSCNFSGIQSVNTGIASLRAFCKIFDPSLFYSKDDDVRPTTIWNVGAFLIRIDSAK